MDRKDKRRWLSPGLSPPAAATRLQIVLFCKCAAGSGVSLHPQYSIQSFHMDNSRNSLPLSFSSSLWQDLKGSSRDLFTSSPLGGIKQADFKREKIMCHESPSGLSLGRYPSQGYLLHDTGKSLTIKSLVQSLGNNTTISLWQSTTNKRRSSKVHGERSKVHDGRFPFYVFIS